MIKSKLFILLKTLSENEIARFGEFLNSPYFNKSKTLIKLFKEYRKSHPDFENLTKEKAFSAAFPDKVFNEVLLRNYNSDMLKLAEDFLTQINLNRNNIFLNERLLNELNHRCLYSLFEKNYYSILKSVEDSPYPDVDYFFNKFIITEEKNQNTFLQNKRPDKKEVEDMQESFMNFALAMLCNHCALKANLVRLKLNFKNDYLLLDELSTVIETNQMNLAPVVLMEYYMMKMLRDTSEKYYLLLKEHVYKYGDQMDMVTQYNAFACMSNFIRHYRDRESMDNMRELFEHTKKMIENKVQVAGSFIMDYVYIEQVRYGLRLKEYPWVHNFIMTYKDWLMDKLKDNAYNFCIGLYNFETKNYEQALKHLSMVSKSVYPHQLNVKNLITRIYWDKNDFDMILSTLASYKQFLKKNKKLTQGDIERHTGFINVLEKMFKNKFDGKEIDIEKLKEESLKCEFDSKDWLMGKIKELEKND